MEKYDGTEFEKKICHHLLTLKLFQTCEFLSSVEHKGMKKFGKLTVAGSHLLKKYNGSQYQ